MKEKKVLNRAKIVMYVLGGVFTLVSLLLVINSGGYDRLAYPVNTDEPTSKEQNSKFSFDTEQSDIIPGNILDRNGVVLCDFSTYAVSSKARYIDNYIYSPLFEVMFSRRDLCEGLIRKYYDVLRDSSESNLRGNDITLTIDHELQKRVYDILSNHLKKSEDNSEEKRASALVLDVDTGEMLACVDFPTFDARDPVSQKQHFFYSRNDHIWPGSTFKVMTSVMLLENGDDETLFSDQDITLDGKTIGNWYTGLGREDYNENRRINYFAALERSSNDFFTRAMLEINNAGSKMTDIANRVSIGKELELDFGSIASSWDLNRADKYTFASTGYGQGEVRISSTHNLMISAAIINGGKVIEPHMIKSITDCFGQEKNLDDVSRKYDIAGLTSDHKTYTLTDDSEVADKIHAAMINNNNAYLISNTEKPWVGAKTGTAEIGMEGEIKVIWIISNAEINGHKYAVVINQYPFYGEINSGSLKEPMNDIYTAIEEIFHDGEEISYSNENIFDYLGDIRSRSLEEPLDNSTDEQEE